MFRKKNVYTTKASVWIMQLNILYYSAGQWSIWKQSSQLHDTSRFVFTFAYTRSFWLLERDSTVKIKIFSSKNQVWLILLWIIRFFKRLHAFNRFSLSAAVRDWTSRRRNTLSCKSFLAIFTTEECEIPVSLSWSPVDSYSCPWLFFLVDN